MAETFIKDEKKQNYPYGITPEMYKVARKKLEQMIQEKGLKAAKTKEELYQYSKCGQTQEEIQAEVDEFLQMREQWREEDKELAEERNETEKSCRH